MGKIIGIDLGTGFSCLSIMEGDKAEVIVNSSGNRTMPSVVAFTDDEKLVGEAAKRQSTTNPERTISEAKRLIGRMFDDKEVQEFRNNASFKIVKGEAPAEIVYKDENSIAFLSINPKAEVHILIVPKKHLDSVASDGSEQVIANLIFSAKKIAQEKNLDGYKLIFNVGKGGGQSVNHLHLHLLAGAFSELPE